MCITLPENWARTLEQWMNNQECETATDYGTTLVNDSMCVVDSDEGLLVGGQRIMRRLTPVYGESSTVFEGDINGDGYEERFEVAKEKWELEHKAKIADPDNPAVFFTKTNGRFWYGKLSDWYSYPDSPHSWPHQTPLTHIHPSPEERITDVRPSKWTTLDGHNLAIGQHVAIKGTDSTGTIVDITHDYGTAFLFEQENQSLQEIHVIVWATVRLDSPAETTESMRLDQLEPTGRIYQEPKGRAVVDPDELDIVFDGP